MTEVYALRIDTRLDKEKFERFLKVVSVEKYERIQRFFRVEDKYRTLLADVLARFVICSKTNLQNEDILFDCNEYGKPYLKNKEGIEFNVSHAGDWIVCAIDDYPVGVDVEHIKPIELGIAKRFFSKKEYEQLLEKAEVDRLGYFYELWTLKESYIKAAGKGLSIPLDSFTFNIRDEVIKLETENDYRGRYFRQYNIDSHYKMAVCSERDSITDRVQIIDINMLDNSLEIFK